MSVTGLLLAVFAASAGVEVLGVWRMAPQVRLPAAVVSLAALAGYAFLRGRGTRRLVWWPLLVALGLSALVTVVGWLSHEPSPRSTVVEFLTPEYVPWQGAKPPTYREVGGWLLGDLWHAAQALVVFGCLALAVLAAPARRRPRLAAASLLIALVAGAAVGWWLFDDGLSAWRGLVARDSSMPYVAAAAHVVAPLLVVIAALTVVVAGGQRAGAGVLAAVGGLFMSVPGLVVEGPLRLAGVPWSVPVLRAGEVHIAALVPGMGAGPASAVVRALYLAGLVLVVAGCLHARPPVVPDVAPARPEGM